MLHSVGKRRKKKKCELFLRNAVLEEVKTDGMQRKRWTLEAVAAR